MKYQGSKTLHTRSRLAAAVVVAMVALAAASPALAGSTRLRLKQGQAPAAEPVSSHDDPHSTDLGLEREQAIYFLHARWVRGDSFALEEVELINRFVGRLGVTRLEADVLISRVLHTVFVVGDSPSDEHARLLDEYLEVLNNEGREIADERVGRELEAAHTAAANLTQALAAPPANDLCAGAVVVPGDGPFPFLSPVVNVTEATITGDPPEPSCFADKSRSVWYRFTPTTTAFYRITTCADAPTATTLDDTQMAIYTSAGGCAGPFTELPFVSGLTNGCGDTGCRSEGQQAEILTQLTASTEYFIVIWKSNPFAPPPANSALQLRVERNLAPANDTCAGAIPVTFNIPLAGTTVGAKNDYQLAAGSPCFTGIGQVATTAPGRDTVHSFTAPSAGTYSIRASGPDNNDSNIVLYTASTCPAATPGTPLTVTCTAASSRNNSRAEQVNLSLSVGQQVFIFVDDTPAAGSQYVGTPYLIEVTLAVSESESNNTTGTADPLSCGLDLNISPATDVDFFSLGTPANGSRVFALLDGSTVSSTNIDMRVTTTTSTLEYDRANADGLFGSNTPAIAGTPLTGVASFLRINRDEANLERGPYRLYAVVQPPGPVLESESNNVRSSSDGNTSNYFSGSLAGPAPSIDVDVFRTPANAGELLFVGLDCDPDRNNTPIQAKMALLDPNGNVLIEVSDGAQTSSTTSGAGSLTATTPFSPAEAFVYRAPVTGNYYVRVEIDTTTTGTLGTGNYLLSISRGCTTGGGSATSGGGVDTIGTYVAADGRFFLRNANSSGTADTQFGFGADNSVPVTGDWNGDGVDTIGTYVQSTGKFFLRNSNSGGVADLSFSFGGIGADRVPISGDWDGDGVETIGIYNATTKTFFLRNSNSPGSADTQFSFGPLGAIPIAGDWNADGVDTIGVYVPSTGTFFLKNTNSSGSADIDFSFGADNSIPLAGDWNGDSFDTVGIYVASTGTFFQRNVNSSGTASATFSFGADNSIPLAGDWNGQ